MTVKTSAKIGVKLKVKPQLSEKSSTGGISSPQSRRDRRENYNFAFAAERPTNTTHHASGKLLPATPCPEGLGFNSFRPSQ